MDSKRNRPAEGSACQSPARLDIAEANDLAHEPCQRLRRSTGKIPYVTLGALTSLSRAEQLQFDQQWRRNKCDKIEHSLAQTRFRNDTTAAGNNSTLSEVRVSFTYELGGGLNNMLMNVAEMLALTCPRGEPLATLVLPRLQTGESFFERRADRQCKPPWPNPNTVGFHEVFDVAALQRALAPCLVAAEAEGEGLGGGAPAATSERSRSYRVWQLPLNINDRFPYHADLYTIYRGLHPAPTIEAQLNVARSHLDARLGSHWAAIHLRIENDW